MKFDLRPQAGGGFVVRDLLVDTGQVTCFDVEVFVTFLAKLGRQGCDRPVPGCDIKDSGAIVQFNELVPPELAYDAIIVIGFAGAEGRNETLLPERRPLFQIFGVGSDFAAPGVRCEAGIIRSQSPKMYENVRRTAYLVVNCSWSLRSRLSGILADARNAICSLT